MTPQEREDLLYKSGKRVLIDKDEQILIKKFNELFINKSIDALDIGCGSGEMMKGDFLMIQMDYQTISFQNFI